jgi:hypothetical protein
MIPLETKKTKLALIMECLLSCAFSQTEEAWLFAAGSAASPDPAWADYIYWPDRYGLDGSVDAAVERAFTYKPIILDSP